MKVAGKIVVVTGGGSGIGIGKAMCHAFHRAGAAKVVIGDIDAAAAEEVAAAIGGRAFCCDVTDETQIQALIETAERDHGPIDLFCSNAGIASGFDQRTENAAAAPNDVWSRAWALNVMAHVYAARALIPLMKSRGVTFSTRFRPPDCCRRLARVLFDHQACGDRLCRECRDHAPR